MSLEHKIKTIRRSDKAVIDLFEKLILKYAPTRTLIKIGAGGNIDLQKEESKNDVEKLKSINSGLIELVNSEIPGFPIQYIRGGYESQKSAFFDEIRFTYSQQVNLSELQRLEIMEFVVSYFPAYDPNRSVSGSANEEQQQLLAIHNSTLERLEEINSELITGSENFRRNLERSFHERSDLLESNFRSRSDKLEEDFQAKSLISSQEHEKKAKAVQEKAEDLERKIIAVDDRANTHARREIRKDILGTVKSRTTEFSLTKSTSNLRWPIHGLCFALLIFLGIASYFFANDLTQVIKDNNAPLTSIVILGLKQFILSGAFGATAVFYIRWLNNWSNEHANAEFRLRQFQLDIERASWVVETALEWKDAKGSIIPNELLEPITRSLFTDNIQLTPTTHPADDLASALLGTASKIKLKSGDSEIELDPKKLKTK